MRTVTVDVEAYGEGTEIEVPGLGLVVNGSTIEVEEDRYDIYVKVFGGHVTDGDIEISDATHATQATKTIETTSNIYDPVVDDDEPAFDLGDEE